jgi:hypothetical protein
MLHGNLPLPEVNLSVTTLSEGKAFHGHYMLGEASEDDSQTPGGIATKRAKPGPQLGCGRRDRATSIDGAPSGQGECLNLGLARELHWKT